MANVRVNKIDDNIDEVFIYQEEPYVNRGIYAKAGLFKTGELSDDEIAKLEQKSIAALAKDQADREAAEISKKAAETKPKAAKEK